MNRPRTSTNLATERPYLLLGGTGLLGRHLQRVWRDGAVPFVAPAHRDLDICDRSAMRAALDSLQPQAVVNCAAFCDFVGCEEDPARSEQVNQNAPLAWARACLERGLYFVQFSSDYIFDGLRQRPYDEDAPPRPLSVYGRHKAVVEQELRALPGVLVLRVAWVFGKAGHTFMSMLPSLLLEKPVLEVASGKRGSCLHADFAARVTAAACSRRLSGLFNLVHRGETAWEIFARVCAQSLAERRLPLRCREIREKPFTTMPQGQGRRPAYSVLDPSALEKALADLWPQGFPTWEQGLQNYLDELFPETARRSLSATAPVR